MKLKLAALPLLAAFPILAQAGRVDEQYIEATFKTLIGEAPKIGWFMSERGLLVTQNVDEVSVLGPIGMKTSGRKTGSVTESEVRGILRLYQFACEVAPQKTMTILDVGRDAQDGRVLYTSKKLTGQLRSGVISLPLSADLMVAVNRTLGWPEKAALRRDEAIAVRADSFFYSFHKLYSSTTGLLRQEAVVLHGRRGQIIALDLKRNLDTAQYCDSCATPSYAYSNRGTHMPLNLFEVSGFPYPLVLLDTGTFEGRARSLLTFTPTGKVAEFREYEYVMNCG
jgi:hypothetical protein